MQHNCKWLVLHDYVLRVISVERGMLRNVFDQKPVPPTLSVGDFPGVRSSRRRTETPITRAGHRAGPTPRRSMGEEVETEERRGKEEEEDIAGRGGGRAPRDVKSPDLLFPISFGTLHYDFWSLSFLPF